MSPSELGPIEFRKLLLELIYQGSGLSDDAIRSLLGQVSKMRSSLSRVLSDSGLYTQTQIGGLLAEVEHVVKIHIEDALADIAEGLESSYLLGFQSAGEMVSAFEVSYPLGIATMDAQTRALALHNTFSKIKLVTDEMQGLISATVQQGVWLNLRPFEVMQQLTHIMGIRDIPGFREFGTTGITAKAERIVRTEMMTAQNMGYWEALQTAGETFPDLLKVWMATGDMRTRDDHLDAHSQQRKWDEDFVVGGETCVGPHDPSLSPRNRINCRCRSVPYREEWGPLSELTGLIDEEVAAEKDRRAEPPVSGDMKPMRPVDDPFPWGTEDYGREWYQEPWKDSLEFPDLTEEWPEFSHEAVMEQKRLISEELAAATGVPEDLTSEFVHTWAISSNNGMASMQIQQAVADKFGIELSEWQQAKLDGFLGKRSSVISGGILPSNARYFGEHQKGIYRIGLRRSGMTSDEAVRALVDEMYDRTQRSLANAGITELVLYRGTDWPVEQLAGRAKGDIVDMLNRNAASSWSMSSETATRFMSFSASEGGQQVVFDAVIPAERVLSTPMFGFGCLNEYELLVVGGPFGDTAGIYDLMKGK